DLRIRLDEQLGVRPGPRLSSVHLQVLRQDVPANLATGRAWPAIPRQLAAPSRLFTGRADELNRLTAVLDECEQSAGVVIWAISGAGSIGKTSLALRWAHQNLDRFPDGQLWVNLRGLTRRASPCPQSWRYAGSSVRSASTRPPFPPIRTRRPACTAAWWPGSGCWWCWTTPATAAR